MNIHTIWKAGGVNRWHYHDNPQLRNSGDTNWAHSGRVAQLVHLFGGTDEEVRIALFHDAPEKTTGDVKAGGKDDEAYEREAAIGAEMGVPTDKTPLVHMCDKLDAYMWAWLHGSGKSRAWQDARHRLMEMAAELRMYDAIYFLLKDVEE